MMDYRYHEYVFGEDDQPREGDYVCIFVDCNAESDAWLVETVGGGGCLLFSDEKALAGAFAEVLDGVRRAAAEGLDVRAWRVAQYSIKPELIDLRELESAAGWEPAAPDAPRRGRAAGEGE